MRLAAVVRWLGRNHPRVLLYHDCADAETAFTADLNCTTPPTVFAQHLDYLAAHHTIVSIEDIVVGRAPRGAVAITFDDGYRSVFTGAFPALKQRGIPATIYLIADVIDDRSLVWVNELNWRLRMTGPQAVKEAAQRLGLPDDSSAASIVDHCRLNFDPGMIADLLQHLRAIDSADIEDGPLYLTAGEINEMAAHHITFGNHTMTHPNLERLTEQEQAHEIGEAQRVLSGRFPMTSSLAYPFGHHGPATARIAREQGLQSVAEVGGLNRLSNPRRIGRTHLADEAIPELFARMEVVEPIKGFLRELKRRG
nr:polysaccharide deacetylase family protein [Sphingomonas kaistensis]